MMTVLLSLLKNPTVLIGAFLVITVGYLYMDNNNLEATVAKRDSTIVVLRSNITTLNENVDTCQSSNGENVKVIAQFQKDAEKVKGYCTDSLNSKDIIIARLRNEVVELKKPIHYEEELNYTDCTVKIKTKDENEDSTFNILTNIGN